MEKLICKLMKQNKCHFFDNTFAKLKLDLDAHKALDWSLLQANLGIVSCLEFCCSCRIFCDPTSLVGCLTSIPWNCKHASVNLWSFKWQPQWQIVILINLGYIWKPSTNLIATIIQANKRLQTWGGWQFETSCIESIDAISD